MKFSHILSMFAGMGFLSGSAASPVPDGGLLVRTDGSGTTQSVSPPVGTDIPSGTVRSEDITDIATYDIDSPEPIDLSKRQTESSRFKLHVVNAAGRVLNIIIVDYLINNLPGTSDDRVTASYGTGTDSRTNGEIKTAFFEGTQFRSDEATFDLATRAISGVFQFNLDPTGAITSLAQSAGIHLGNLIVANKLRIFNAKNTLVATLQL